MAAVMLLSCGRPEPADLVIRHATIVDIATGELKGDQAVVVRDGLIAAVIPAERASAYHGTAEVDADGRFLMPALADAHVHLQNASELELYLRYGVGLIVNMAGSPMHLDLREAIEEGRRVGPRIITAGPTLDGPEPTNPLFTSVTWETAEEVVAWIADRGYDVVKVYQQLDAGTLETIVRAADSRGLVTTGHVSRSLGARGVLDAGLRYVAHGEELAFESFDEETRGHDRSRIPELTDLLAQRGVTVTPMINYLEQVPDQVLALDEYLGSAPMSLVPAGMKLSFGPRQGWFSSRDEPEAFADQMADAADFVAELTAALNARDVRLILGTDAGFGGAIPGYAVHRELESLVAAGLSELEALRTATLDVGRFVQEIDPDRAPWGRIEPGFSADLLLLARDPLSEISATREIEGVALAGRWYSRGDLARIEERLQARQQSLLPLAQSFEDAIARGDVAAAGEALDSALPDLDGDTLVSASNCIFLGYRFFYGGQRGLAGQIYEICAEMHPDSAPLWWHIGQAREDSGAIDGAIHAYSSALEANPWYRQPAEAMRRLEEGPD
jgi:imidazolonepropionase-like amidohydrolase